MGTFRRLAGMAALAAFVVPPVAAAWAKQRLVSEGDADSPEIALVSIFEGTRLASRAKGFRGGSLLAWYSGTELDLRDAELDPAGGRLEVTALFSGVEIRVPMHWKVRVQRRMAFASGIDVNARTTGTGPELLIEPRAAFAGVQITMRPPREDEMLIPPPVPAADLTPEGLTAEDLTAAESAAATLATAEVEGGPLPVEPVAGEKPPAEG